jgi:hypothetical protein
VIKPGTGEDGEPAWSYAFTEAWGGLSSDFINSCYPPAVAEKMFGAKNVEFNGTVARKSASPQARLAPCFNDVPPGG